MAESTYNINKRKLAIARQGAKKRLAVKKKNEVQKIAK